MSNPKRSSDQMDETSRALLGWFGGPRSPEPSTSSPSADATPWTPPGRPDPNIGLALGRVLRPLENYPPRSDAVTPEPKPNPCAKSTSEPQK